MVAELKSRKASKQEVATNLALVDQEADEEMRKHEVGLQETKWQNKKLPIMEQSKAEGRRGITYTYNG